MGVRRVFIAELRPGRLALPAEAAHHLTGVLRLEAGAQVIAFNRTGEVADATLVGGPAGWELEVANLRSAGSQRTLIVASAVPKGDRADWLVEKLAEMGVARWVPLKTERSVVHPEGTAKAARWERIAVEAARQSAAAGVVEIRPLQELKELLREMRGKRTWVCSTGEGSLSVREAETPELILVGPEGGWSSEEEAAIAAWGAHRVTLGTTILRIETACVVAAAMARD